MKDLTDIAQELTVIYERNNWTWGLKDVNEHIPTVNEIIETITELSKELDENENIEWTTTGRLRVERGELGKELSLVAYHVDL